MTSTKHKTSAFLLAAGSGAWALAMLFVGWYRHSLVLSPCDTSCGRSLGFVLLEVLGIALWFGSVGFAVHALIRSARTFSHAPPGPSGWRSARFAVALGIAWGTVVAFSNAR